MGIRRGAAAAVVVSALVVHAPRVGERQSSSATQAIVTLKTIQSAQSAYSRVHGYYDTLECLSRPQCGPPAPEGREAFLSPDLVDALERRGYRIELVSGPSAWDETMSDRSRSAMTRFAIVAVPNRPRGGRSFCADDTFTVYALKSGALPRVEGGRCVDVATPVR